MNMSLQYSADMWSERDSAGHNPDGYDLSNQSYAYFNESTPQWEDVGEYAWNYASPSRLLIGTAFTLGKRAIISADYERSWYQSIHLRHSPIWGLDYTSIMKQVFKGGNTLRVGAECYVLPFMALRAGYIWSGNTLRKGFEKIIASHTMPVSQAYITAGLGLKLNESVYVEVAYQYGITRYTDYQTFYYVDNSDSANDFGSRIFNDVTTKPIAVVTLGIRF
jgi:hypothetical protein